jgi:branched-chain amino acid transport system ATP-binding protein
VASSLLEVRGVEKSFGPLKALGGVDLTVAANEFHGLIGPNGSGKSTLLHTVAGGLPPDRGTVTLDGRDITAWAASSRTSAGLSIKFQIARVFTELSVYDNVLLALQADQSLSGLLRSRSRRRLGERVIASLRSFRLAFRADDLAGELSHGEMQWLEIAMALASQPKMLLLDEPTAGMSPEERRVTGDLLRPIKPTCSILIVEHDLDFIRSFCDTITVLEQGRVLAAGTPAQIEADERVREVYVTRV